MPTDYLRNYRPDVSLNVFDGHVAALAQLRGEEYLITTPCNYVPKLPPIEVNHKVFLRTNFRFGMDDPSLWPQQFMELFPHLGLIRKRPEVDSELAILWWDPTREDFWAGSTITRNLGKLAHPKFKRLLNVVDLIIPCYRSYCSSCKEPPPPILNELVRCMGLAMERLQSLPSTFEKMAYGVTTVQRVWLELDALLEYCTVYKPRIDKFGNAPTHDLPLAADRLGAFTSEPRWAQLLFDARIPYWFVRPSHAFESEMIVKIVGLEQPRFYIPEDPAPGYNVLFSGNKTVEKIKAIYKAGVETPWYHDPFDIPNDVPVPKASAAAEAGPSNAVARATGNRNEGHSVGGTASGSGGRGRGQRKLNAPYPNARSKGGKAKSHGPPKVQRDKFAPFQADEMPRYLEPWADTLRAVDQKLDCHSFRPSDLHYIMPEPALIVSPEDPERRRMFIHHWFLVKDAVEWHASNEGCALSNPEWRDLLEGKIEVRGFSGSRTEKRSWVVEKLLGPMLRACNLDRLHGFPPDRQTIPVPNLHKMREMVWRVAESNFRFELCSLDRRASRKERLDVIKMCFAGGYLVGMPLANSKHGLAAPTLEERRRYYVRLANIMLDWATYCPRPPAIVAGLSENVDSKEKMKDLEGAVARYYTQAFFEYFGWAAVIPMGLDHEIDEDEPPVHV
ncbi:hypothetical protein FB451DRAFT_777755 [Mycena latifolia]|nr:hypothetical protein FB451DRAFT_777755 [Mycena latifolia]